MKTKPAEQSYSAPVLFFSNFILYPQENSVEERVESGPSQGSKNTLPIIISIVFFLFGKYLI